MHDPDRELLYSVKWAEIRAIELRKAYKITEASEPYAAEGPCVLLPLNPYQAANLLWLLKRCCTQGTEPPGSSFNPRNSGDWCGEIPHALEPLMKASGAPFVGITANGGGDPYANPTWVINDPTHKHGHYRWDDPGAPAQVLWERSPASREES